MSSEHPALPPPRLGALFVLCVSLLFGWTLWAVWLRDWLLSISPQLDLTSGVVARLVFWVLPCVLYLTISYQKRFLQPLGWDFPLGRRQVVQTIAVTALVSSLLLMTTAAQLDVSLVRLISKLLTGPSAGLSAPLFEEPVFRGVVLSELLNWTHRTGRDPIELRIKYWVSQLAAAVVFVAIHWPYWWSHLGLQATLAMSGPILVTGLILGFVFAHTRSLWACIFLHWLNNQLSTLS